MHLIVTKVVHWLTELRSLLGFNAVTDRDNRVEILMLNFPLNLAFTLLPNYKEFPYSCRRLKLSLGEHVSNVLVNGDDVLIK